MRVIKAPPIQFKCESCGAINEGEPEEFRACHTAPPSFDATCAFCHLVTRCYSSALIARTVGMMSGAEANSNDPARRGQS